ncbi:hypothetical protein FVF58_37560 [Paraburkholderia panacisoli]|jgi:glutathione S-transferase|uniref:Uncharacterized protein n=1 Tax=Paraburkholderia panacisoli TaxID=2603818 RepID=A0A5B0GGI2_9BURK|nr:hypothetical protein [Paraburkholderia panacisoli]KAA1002473.1 hypothetical protein FVF58_37560 [Paraburkholderia panacisoli]
MIVDAGDAGVVAACRTRIAKKLGGIAVRRDAAFQRTARHHVEGVLTALDRTPGSAPAPYLAGCAFALGDVLWGVNLVRLAYLGLTSRCDDLPNVARYFDAPVKRHSLCTETVRAMIDLLPPSRQIDAMASCMETAPT